MTSYNSRSDDEDDHYDSWKDELQSFRWRLVETINYEKIKAALLSIGVVDNDDNEEITNHYTNPNMRQRLNHFIDILMRKGEVNYKKFFEVLGYYYPQLYKEMHGVEPSRPEWSSGDSSAPDIENGGPGDMVQLLMQALEKMRQKNIDLGKHFNKSKAALDERDKEVIRLKQRMDDLMLRVTRYENVDNEMATVKKEVDRLKTENLNICMRVIETNENNAQIRTVNMSLKNENDKVKAELETLKKCVDLEKTQSFRLRRQLQSGPSDRDVIKMKKEIDELRLKLAHASNPQTRDCDIDMRIQILQRDKEEALEMYGEAIGNLNKLREEFANAEAQRDQYLDEKEQLELECTVLRNDCNMYKNRRDSVWQQLQEVEKEREMIIKERNDAQLFTRDCMQEKTKYRALIRELEEKYDKMSQELLARNKELARLQAVKSRQQCMPTINGESEDWFEPTEHHKNSSFCSSTPSSSNSRHPYVEEKIPDLTMEKELRKRAYITKQYQKYVSKSPTTTDDLIKDLGNGLKNVFSEVPLSCDYLNLDAEATSLDNDKNFVPLRRVAQRRRSGGPGRNGNSDAFNGMSEAVSTSSISNDENEGKAKST